MLKVEVDITLVVSGPLLTKDTAPGEYGFDATPARTADGTIFLPGTHVTGKLRQAWEELADALDGESAEFVPDAAARRSLLGAEPEAGGDLEPRAKRLFFSDFLLTNKLHPAGTPRYRIQLDPTRGAVKKGAQMVIESPFAPGERLEFTGRLRMYCPDEHEAAEISEQVRCGLQWVPQLGGLRGIGFGRLQEVCMHPPEISRIVVREHFRTGGTGAGGLDISIRPLEPFCIARRPVAPNLFVPEEIIPGSAILGMVARTLSRIEQEDNTDADPQTENEFVQLRQHINDIRISHAFPSEDCRRRPVFPPASLVRAGGVFDAALLDRPHLIQGQPPAFRVDWKDAGDVLADFGWPSLQRELRVRTAIDPKYRRSKDEQLFAYEMIIPGHNFWQARIDLSRITDEDNRRQVLNQLASLLAPGLLGLGKSKVAAEVILHEPDTFRDVSPAGGHADTVDGDNLLVITLQTPALLFHPDRLDKHRNERALRKAYKDSWQSLCPELQLVRYFARQSMTGGEYLRRRFQMDPYRPWLLTEAGSVFVFAVSDDQAVSDTINVWLHQGLPLPQPVLDGYGLSSTDGELWQRCPYLPQNGYGEIAVNLSVHEAWRPAPDICTPIPVLEESSHE